LLTLNNLIHGAESFLRS